MKVLKAIKRKSKVLIGAFVTALTLVTTGIVAMASTGSGTTISYSDFSSLFTTLTGQINVTTILGVIGGVAAVCIGLVFFWWGVRKVIRMLMSAFRGGRFSA